MSGGVVQVIFAFVKVTTNDESVGGGCMFYSVTHISTCKGQPMLNYKHDFLFIFYYYYFSFFCFLLVFYTLWKSRVVVIALPGKHKEVCFIFSKEKKNMENRQGAGEFVRHMGALDGRRKVRIVYNRDVMIHWPDWNKSRPVSHLLTCPFFIWEPTWWIHWQQAIPPSLLNWPRKN